MKKKQQSLTIIGLDGKFLAPNRKTARTMKAKNVDFTRIENSPAKSGTKSELAQFKKELARKHGSKTGKLKKKHLRRKNETNL